LSEKQFIQLTDDDGQLSTVSADVQVVGSAQAASFAEAVRKDLNDILNLGLSNRLSGEEINTRVTSNEHMLGRFIRAVHDELNK